MSDIPVGGGVTGPDPRTEWTVYVCPTHRGAVEVTKGGSYCSRCGRNVKAESVTVVPLGSEIERQRLEAALREIEAATRNSPREGIGMWVHKQAKKALERRDCE